MSGGLERVIRLAEFGVLEVVVEQAGDSHLPFSSCAVVDNSVEKRIAEVPDFASSSWCESPEAEGGTQGERIAHRVAGGVVVEVDVGVAAGARQALRIYIDDSMPIVAGRAPAPVETEIEPVSGDPVGVLQTASAICPDQCGVVMLQDLANAVDEPGGVPKFDGDANTRRKRFERPL
jgi:hypothetical protein